MKKTELEIFKEIEEVEVAPDNEGEPLNSVKEILPYFCEKVEKALKRLDSIDNAEPSKALTYIDAFIEENNNDIKNQDTTGFDIDNQAKWVKYLEHKSVMLSTIKQALLKAQEPKKYLKWEDLEFTRDEQKIKVKLNGENYTVVYFISPANYGRNGYEYVGILKDDDIVVYSITCYLSTAYLCKQFFNNLHLERVE